MNTNEANLGYASNAELCAELDARQSMGHTAPDYRTVDWNDGIGKVVDADFHSVEAKMAIDAIVKRAQAEMQPYVDLLTKLEAMTPIPPFVINRQDEVALPKAVWDAAERNNVARSQQGHSCTCCNGTGTLRRNLGGGDYEDEPCPECTGSGFFDFLTIDGLQAAVDERAQFIDPNGRLDLAFFAVELGGEAGEALNKVKKLIREKMGIAGSRVTTAELADELADVIITACNVARLARIDLNQSIRRKFNETSRVRGLPVKI